VKSDNPKQAHVSGLRAGADDLLESMEFMEAVKQPSEQQKKVNRSYNRRS